MPRLTATLLAVLLASPYHALAARTNRMLLLATATHPIGRSLKHAPDPRGINPSVKLFQTTAPGDTRIPTLGLELSVSSPADSSGSGARKLLKTGNGAGSAGHNHDSETERLQSSSSAFVQPPLAGAAAAQFAHVESAAADRFAQDKSGLVYARDGATAAGGVPTAATGARKLAAAPAVSVLHGHDCMMRRPAVLLS
jgi:hypothetical protein